LLNHESTTTRYLFPHFLSRSSSCCIAIVLSRQLLYKTYPDEKNKKIILTGSGDSGILRCAYRAVFGSVGAEYFCGGCFLWYVWVQ